MAYIKISNGLISNEMQNPLVFNLENTQLNKNAKGYQFYTQSSNGKLYLCYDHEKQKFQLKNANRNPLDKVIASSLQLFNQYKSILPSENVCIENQNGSLGKYYLYLQNTNKEETSFSIWLIIFILVVLVACIIYINFKFQKPREEV